MTIKANKYRKIQDVPDTFAVFILSHGRADNLITLPTLFRCGYQGRYYIVIDNEDEQAEEYYDKFGKDHVIMFDKLKVSQTFDHMHNFGKRNTIVYARNACFDIAKELGVTHFLQLDDDYKDFQYRYPEDGKLKIQSVRSMNPIINYMLEFLDNSNALTVAFAQGGDLIGGLDGMWTDKVKRKAMNSFFCRTDRPVNFVGHINEDVNTYVSDGLRGELFLTITDVILTQAQTQSNSGGMTGAYLDNGTYLKSIYTVMQAPSCAKISTMGGTHKRLHHKIYWNNCTPKILSEKHKKKPKRKRKSREVK